MYCISCGKELEPGTRFCDHCGARQDVPGQPGAGAGPVQVGQPPVPPGPPRGPGGPATPPPPMGQPPMGQPPVGQPPMGQPPMGQPPMGQPPMGQPPMGQPPMGQPPMGQPPMGQPPMGQPPVGQPPMGQQPPAFGGPGPMGVEAPPKPKKKLPLWPFLVGGGVLLVIIGLVVALFVVKNLHSPERTIAAFVQAMEDRDVDAMAKVARVEEDRLPMDYATLSPFFAAHSGSALSMGEDLRLDAERMKTGLEPMGNGLVRLEGEKKLFYTDYTVVLVPTEVRVESEFEGTEFVLTAGGTDRKFTVGGGYTVVTLLPGEYRYSASYTAPSTGVTLTRSAETLYVDQWQGSVYIWFDYTSVYIEGGSELQELTAITIDGSPYLGDLDELGLYYGFYLSPVNYDSVVEVTVTTFGVEDTRTFYMDESTYCYLDAQLPAALQQTGEELAESFAPLYMDVNYAYSQEAMDEMWTLLGYDSSDYLTDLEESMENTRFYAEDIPEYYSRFTFENMSCDWKEVNYGPYLYNESAEMSMKVHLTGYAYHFDGWYDTVPDNEFSFSGTVWVSMNVDAMGNWSVTSASYSDD